MPYLGMSFLLQLSQKCQDQFCIKLQIFAIELLAIFSLFQIKMSRDKQIEMRNRHVNSWSHINCDEPVLWSHQTKISRFPQTLEQYECGMCIQVSFTSFG